MKHMTYDEFFRHNLKILLSMTVNAYLDETDKEATKSDKEIIENILKYTTIEEDAKKFVDEMILYDNHGNEIIDDYNCRIDWK